MEKATESAFTSEMFDRPSSVLPWFQQDESLEFLKIWEHRWAFSASWYKFKIGFVGTKVLNGRWHLEQRRKIQSFNHQNDHFTTGWPRRTVAVLWLRKDDYRIENKRFGRRKLFEGRMENRLFSMSWCHETKRPPSELKWKPWLQTQCLPGKPTEAANFRKCWAPAPEPWHHLDGREHLTVSHWATHNLFIHHMSPEGLWRLNYWWNYRSDLLFKLSKPADQNKS